MLRDHSDVWHVGKESIDMRVRKSVFARVQRYFPECVVQVSDLEAHMQEAEKAMFPRKKAEQEAWEKAVVQAMLPKVCVCRKATFKVALISFQPTNCASTNIYFSSRKLPTNPQIVQFK